MPVLSGLRESIKFCMDYNHTSRPDFESCDLAHPVDNMSKVFQVVEKFGIIKLLNLEDVAKAVEEKSIITCVSYPYQV